MHRNSGFTLIELMITVAIVAILAAIVYPSYQDQVLKSHRTEGKTALMQVAQNFERCFTTANSYAACRPLADATSTFPWTTEHGRYQISVNTPRQANTYTLRATPQQGQTKDTRCGTLTLDETGRKGENGTGTVQDCW